MLQTFFKLRSYGASAGSGAFIINVGGGGGSADSEALRIDSSGNVGIGTTSMDSNLHIVDGTTQVNIEATTGDATLKLECTGENYWNIFNDTSDSNKLKFEDNGNGVLTTIDRNGNVGIGTTSPSVPLDIIRNLSSDTTTSPDTVLTIATKYASTGSNGGAGAGSRLELQIPDDETNPITGAAIAGLKENADDSVANAALAFYTSQNDTTLDEAMRIDSSGNVGIGTTPASASSTTRMHIHNGASTAILQLTGAGVGTTASDGTELAADDNGDFRIRNFESGSMQFFNNGSERMRINDAGDVLIGGTQEYNTLNGRGNLVVGSGSGNEGITIITGTSNTGGLTFADGTSGDAAYRGQIEYRHDLDAFLFTTAATERMRISSAGNVHLQGSDARIQLNSGGAALINSIITV